MAPLRSISCQTRGFMILQRFHVLQQDSVKESVIGKAPSPQGLGG